MWARLVSYLIGKKTWATQWQCVREWKKTLHTSLGWTVFTFEGVFAFKNVMAHLSRTRWSVFSHVHRSLNLFLYLKTYRLVNFQWCVCISGAPAVYMLYSMWCVHVRLDRKSEWSTGGWGMWNGRRLWNCRKVLEQKRSLFRVLFLDAWSRAYTKGACAKHVLPSPLTHVFCGCANRFADEHAANAL